ncbi:MAG: cbb3-type cytochrome c oxidase N-terminal domain-containing protein [Bacteroidia bacterium]
MNKYIKAFAFTAFIALALIINTNQAKGSVVNLSFDQIELGFNIPLLADYVNPYTSDGARANSPKMGDSWSWFLVSLVALILIIIAQLIMIQQRLNQYNEKQRAKEAKEKAAVYHEKSTWWEIFVKPEKDKPLDAPIEGHNYDGIVELDNNPPAWFNWLFFLPIAFGFVYIMYYHVLGIGHLQVGEYEAAVAEAEADMPEITIDYASLEPLSASADIETGASIFKANCAACHLENGGGSVGPNLTDNQWIHGGDFGSIYETIYEGVDGKGMAAWGEILLSEEVHKVASYVETMRNTNVEGGKAPEGEVYNP